MACSSQFCSEKSMGRNKRIEINHVHSERHKGHLDLRVWKERVLVISIIRITRPDLSSG